MDTRRRLLLAGACGLAVPPTLARGAGAETIVNASHDTTRELYRALNEAFIAQWRARTGTTPAIDQSHAGSARQARAVIAGLEADVVTLALAADIDAIADQGLIARDWSARLPNDGSPFTSTIVLVVRKGNPKQIRDWSDLARPGIAVLTPNPKTSGGARWNYLAAWGYALRKHGNDEAVARRFVAEIFANVPMLESDARAAMLAFARRGLGDAVVAWECEALRAVDSGIEGLEVVAPSMSILAELPVAVVDRVVEKRGTRALAEAYLRFLYTPEAQEVAAQQHYRPRDAALAARHRGKFPALELFTVGEMFGGWRAAHAKHFAEGGSFDAVAGGRR
jgi:sulfate/thiosulfate transport system substrate-binding protein